MRIFRNELVKFFTSKFILSAFGMLLLINVIIIFNQAFNSGGKINFYLPSAYRAIYTDIEEMSTGEQKQYIEELCVKYYTMQDDEHTVGSAELYTENEKSEIALLSDVLEVTEECENYQEFLNGIKSDATLGISMGLFADSDTYTYKNVQKTLKDFKDMFDISLVAGPIKGIFLATDCVTTDLLVIIFIMAAVAFLVLRERETAVLNLCKTVYNGRLPLGVVKAGVIVLVSILTVILFYGVNYLLGYAIYGMGDLSRPVQSVLSHCVLKVSVEEYLFLYILGKCIAVMGIAMFFYLAATVCATAMQFYLVTVITTILASLGYYSLSATSNLVLLKYLNPVAFLDTNSVLGYYRNINIAGNPVTYLTLFCLVSMLSIFIFTYYGASLFADLKEAVLSEGSRLSVRIIDRTGKRTGIFLHELYKCFIGGRVLVILVIYAIFTIISYKPVRESYYIMEDSIYNSYISILTGPWSDEKTSYVNNEVIRIEELEKEKETRLSEAETEEEAVRIEGFYDTELLAKSAVVELEAHTEYLETVNGDYYIDTGYKLLTGYYTALNKDAWLALLAVLVLIVCLSYIYSVEFAYGMNSLLKTTLNGRGRTMAYKLLIGMIIIVSVFLLTYVPVYYSVLKEFGIAGIHFKACSMSHLSSVPGSISVLLYLIIKNCLRIAGMIIMMAVIFVLSSKLKSFVSTILISVVLFATPIVLFIAEVPGAKYILLNSFLI
ncbi:MAG: hypothetical protein ACI39R_06615 [Lachnospiraceae bacterium]